MTRPINFLDAFTAIEGELRYQDKLWGEGAEGREAYSGGTAFDRSLDEYTLYIHRYCNKLAAENCRSTQDFNDKLDTVRKIAALCVACMSTQGVTYR